MAFPSIVPTFSPATSTIFWKQVKTGVIEITFHGGVVARLLLQRIGHSFVDRIVKGFQQCLFSLTDVKAWSMRLDNFSRVSLGPILIEATAVFTFSSLWSRHPS